MDDSILFNLSGADHQLTEQFVPLAERCFLFLFVGLCPIFALASGPEDIRTVKTDFRILRRVNADLSLVFVATSRRIS